MMGLLLTWVARSWLTRADVYVGCVDVREHDEPLPHSL